MNLYAIFAIYALFWVISAFVVLPFGLQTPHESGEVLVRGQADSAPSNFRPGRVAFRATVLSASMFGLYYVNYVEGWVTVETLTGLRR